MSCPRWNELVADRERTGEDPQGWEEALAHLDFCPRCTRQAPAVDPLLLFRRLPAPKVGSADIESMKAGVAAMIRASRVESSVALPAAPGRRGQWRVAAAVAATLLVSLGLGGVQLSRVHRASNPLVATSPAEGVMAAQAVVQEPLGDESTIEDLSLSDARVYEVASDGLSVVTIVHPSLEL